MARFDYDQTYAREEGSGDLNGLDDLLGEWSEEELRLWAAFYREHEMAVIHRGERGALAPIPFNET